MLKKFLVLLAAIMCMLMSTGVSASQPRHVTFTEQNTIVLRGEVTGESVAKVSEALLKNPNKEVWLYLASPGGSVQDGLALVDVMKGSGKTVNCVAGFAASMAFYILQACDHRYVMDHSLIMQHVVSYGVEGQEPNNWSRVNALHKMAQHMAEVQAKRIGIPLADFIEKTRGDWWLMGADAVTEKAADEVVTATCNAKLTGMYTTETMKLLFWSFDVTYSGCPLIEGPLAIKPTPAAPGQQGPGAKQEYDSFIEKLNLRSYFTKLMSTEE